MAENKTFAPTHITRTTIGRLPMGCVQKLNRTHLRAWRKFGQRRYDRKSSTLQVVNYGMFCDVTFWTLAGQLCCVAKTESHNDA